MSEGEREQKIEKERERERERDEKKKWAIQSNLKVKRSARYLADPSR